MKSPKKSEHKCVFQIDEVDFIPSACMPDLNSAKI